METSENIKSYYQDYISIYKDETDRLKQFKTFIDKTESDQLFDRKNFVGHITGSAICMYMRPDLRGSTFNQTHHTSTLVTTGRPY